MRHMLAIQVTTPERAAYDEAAKEAGMTRHAWMRTILSVAADFVPEATPGFVRQRERAKAMQKVLDEQET